MQGAFVESDGEAIAEDHITKRKPNESDRIESLVRRINEICERKEKQHAFAQEDCQNMNTNVFDSCEQTGNSNESFEKINPSLSQVYDTVVTNNSIDQKTFEIDLYHSPIEQETDNNIKNEELEANIDNVLSQLNDGDSDELELIFDLDSNSLAIGDRSISDEKPLHESTESALKSHENPNCFDINLENETKKILDLDRQALDNLSQISFTEQNQTASDNENEFVVLDLDSNTRIKSDSIASDSIANTTVPPLVPKRGYEPRLIFVPSNDPTKKKFDVHIITEKTKPTETPKSTTFTNSEIRIQKLPSASSSTSADDHQSLFKQPRLKFFPNTPTRTPPNSTSNSSPDKSLKK